VHPPLLFCHAKGCREKSCDTCKIVVNCTSKSDHSYVRDDGCHVTEGSRAVCDAHAIKCGFCGARFCKDCSVDKCSHFGRHGGAEVELHVIDVSISDDFGTDFEETSFWADATVTSDVPGWIAAYAATAEGRLGVPKRARGMLDVLLGDRTWYPYTPDSKAARYARYDGSDAAFEAMSARVTRACPKHRDSYNTRWLTREELFFDHVDDGGRSSSLITCKPLADVKAALKAAMLKSQPGWILEDDFGDGDSDGAASGLDGDAKT
jgi:hypothetical protein